MNRLRSLLLSPAPKPGPRRPRGLQRRPHHARLRRELPSVHPVHLHGRQLSTRSRVLSGWTGIVPDVLLTLLLVVLSFSINLLNVEKTEFHADESRWMNRAYYARELGEPFGPTWQEYVTTIGQPPLGSVVMGIGLAIQGYDLDATGVWDFAYGSDWNERMGAVPDDPDRFAARRTNAVIGALVAGASFVLGRLLTNRFGGIIAATFLAGHPLHIVLSTQALSDQTLALLLALIFITGWCFAKKPTWRRAILLGILLGLGGSVKLTPLLLAGPLAGFGVLRWLVHRDAASRRYAWMMLAQPVIAFVTFVVSYPFLWPDPIGRTYRLYAFRAEEMADQSTAWPEFMVHGPLDSLSRFGHRLTHDNSTSQSVLAQFFKWFGFDVTPAGLDLIPAVAGIVVLVWWVARKGFWTPAAMVALLMGLEAGILVVGMKTDFYRYHLPILIIVAGCIGVSSGAAWSAGRRLLARRRAAATAPAALPVSHPARATVTHPSLAPINTSASGELSR